MSAKAHVTRTETDSFGEINVPQDALWGAQTARSLRYFDIGEQRMPLALIHAIAWIKWAAAGVNGDLNLLDEIRAKAISVSAQRVAQSEFDGEFPLSVWQTGSATQSHMNVNEVIGTLANRWLDAHDHADLHVNAHDHVNLGQSSNDVVPSAMHLAVALRAKHQLLPALRHLGDALSAKAFEFHDIVKIGRTHLQDATPVTMEQEFGGYAAQLALCEDSLVQALSAVHTLAIGGTAVGTGLNTAAQFGARVTAALAHRFDLPFVPAKNLFAALAGHEVLVAFHGAMKMLAIALTKVGSDIRLMGSGPRAGLGELRLPANEPGSSIMPGKVNPTQIEALLMVCAQVMGHDMAIAIGASQGHFELNTYKPLIALNTLDSLRLLTDAMNSFATHCVAGLRADVPHIEHVLRGSLMLATALSPHIGYDRAGQVARHAEIHGTTLREAALALGISGSQFDEWVDPLRMLSPADRAPAKASKRERKL